VIQPGQGFGTGSHPTTRALLTWLEAEPGERVLDVGCGSGVLGVAALLLGARFAVGLDPDPDALANADENRRRNGVGRELRLVRGSVEAISEPVRFDRVLANLDRGTLDRLVDTLVARCAPAGRIGIAGLLAAEAEGFRAILRACPVEIVDERTDADASTGDVWWSAWLARAGPP
jgi:ribosomal protein L11 methyltransferase